MLGERRFQAVWTEPNSSLSLCRVDSAVSRRGGAIALPNGPARPIRAQDNDVAKRCLGGGIANHCAAAVRRPARCIEDTALEIPGVLGAASAVDTCDRRAHPRKRFAYREQCHAAWR